MANSWNGPQLGSPIRTDVPELQKKLIALLKQDPTSVANIPSGAKRLVNTSGVQWQVQQYNGSRWDAIGKLMHDVDKLDGYHAAITPAANTVAVRNADKKLEGDITGNAATASSAATLSQTLPVNKGGTGATTAAAARTKLGVPPTSHASSGTAYGLGTDTEYGHVRSDGDTTNIVAGEVVVKDVAIGGDVTDLASERGIFNSKPKGSVDYNTILKQGFYTAYATGSTNGPGGPRRLIVLNGADTDNDTIQIAVTNAPSSSKNLNLDIRAFHPTVGWVDWTRFISEHNVATASVAGIMKPGDGLEAEANGVVSVDDTVVRTSGAQNIKGVKTFTGDVHLSKGGACRYVLQNLDLPAKRSDPASKNVSTRLDFYNAGGISNATNRMAILQFSKFSDGNCTTFISANNPYNDDAEESTQLGCGWTKDANGVPFAYAYCQTPAAGSNAGHIATTKWVRNYAPLASTTKAGLVKIGEGLSVGSDGTLTANSFPTPDWAAKKARSFYTSYTATEDGYLFINMCASNYTDGFHVTVGGLTFSMIGKENYGWVTDTVCLPIKKGTTYSTSKANDYDPGASKMFFIPVAN